MKLLTSPTNVYSLSPAMARCCNSQTALSTNSYIRISASTTRVCKGPAPSQGHCVPHWTDMRILSSRARQHPLEQAPQVDADLASCVWICTLRDTSGVSPLRPTMSRFLFINVRETNQQHLRPEGTFRCHSRSINLLDDITEPTIPKDQS
jgi:hypothetical protein